MFSKAKGPKYFGSLCCIFTLLHTSPSLTNNDDVTEVSDHTGLHAWLVSRRHRAISQNIFYLKITVPKLSYVQSTVSRSHAHGATGLACITPASGYVHPWASVIIGLAGGTVSFWTSILFKETFMWDDVLDVGRCIWLQHASFGVDLKSKSKPLTRKVLYKFFWATSTCGHR